MNEQTSKEYIDIDTGIEFQNVVIPKTVFLKNKYIGIENGIEINDQVTQVTPFINAVDINWNKALVEIGGTTRSIDTTAQLLKFIEDIPDGKSAYTIYAESEIAADRRPMSKADWLLSLKGKTAYEVYRAQAEEAGDTPMSEADWLASLKGDPGITTTNLSGIGLNTSGTLEYLLVTDQNNGVHNFYPKSDWNADPLSSNGIQNKPSNQDLQADWNESNTTSPKYINNKPSNTNFQADWNEASTTSLGYIKNKPQNTAFQANWNTTDNTSLLYIQNKPWKRVFNSISRVVYGNLDSSPEVNGLLNAINGYNSVALGVKNDIRGNNSVSEGYEALVKGDYSHAAGYDTQVSGWYSYGSGLSSTFSLESLDVLSSIYDIKGNYSFGIGYNIVTKNNGEVAFGAYNNSRTIDTVKFPVEGQTIYDNTGRKLSIVSFHLMSLETPEPGTTYFDFLNDVSECDNVSGSLNLAALAKYEKSHAYNYGTSYGTCIIGVIVVESSHMEDADPPHEFFFWGPNGLYYNDASTNDIVTMFSIGDGNPSLRHNLVEITSDGNFYYKHGQLNLFNLETQLNDLENTVVVHPTTATPTLDERESLLDTRVLEINPSLTNLALVNLNSIEWTEDYYLNFVIKFVPLSNNLTYLKRTIIIPGISLTNPVYLYFENDNTLNLHFHTEVLFNLDSDDNPVYMTLEENEDISMYRIEIEIINNDCFIDIKTYKKNNFDIQPNLINL